MGFVRHLSIPGASQSVNHPVCHIPSRYEVQKEGYREEGQVCADLRQLK